MTQVRPPIVTTEWRPLTTEALARPNSAPTKSFVYFIADRDRRLIKIGFSKDSRKRLRELRREHGTDLALVGVLAGGAALEKELHAEFAADRVYGEWFRGTERMVALVEAMFDAATRSDRPDVNYEDHLTPRYSEAEKIALLLGVSVVHARRLIASGVYGTAA